jgi:hypothetical protein
MRAPGLPPRDEMCRPRGASEKHIEQSFFSDGCPRFPPWATLCVAYGAGLRRSAIPVFILIYVVRPCVVVVSSYQVWEYSERLMAGGGEAMRRVGLMVGAVLVASLAAGNLGRAQEQKVNLEKIAAAKTVFFDDQTGDAAVGGDALAELKKWGKFQIVQDQKQADLIVLLSIDPYHAGSVVMADGKIGVSDANGNVTATPADDHKKSASSRDAYLTVIEPNTNAVLWSDSHVWGGVLTGTSSAGERLVKKLEKDVGK